MREYHGMKAKHNKTCHPRERFIDYGYQEDFFFFLLLPADQVYGRLQEQLSASLLISALVAPECIIFAIMPPEPGEGGWLEWFHPELPYWVQQFFVLTSAYMGLRLMRTNVIIISVLYNMTGVANQDIHAYLVRQMEVLKSGCGRDNFQQTIVFCFPLLTSTLALISVKSPKMRNVWTNSSANFLKIAVDICRFSAKFLELSSIIFDESLIISLIRGF